MSSRPIFNTETQRHRGTEEYRRVIQRDTVWQSAASRRWVGPLCGPTIETESNRDTNDTSGPFARVSVRLRPRASRRDAHRREAAPLCLCVSVPLCLAFLCASL